GLGLEVDVAAETVRDRVRLRDVVTVGRQDPDVGEGLVQGLEEGADESAARAHDQVALRGIGEVAALQPPVLRSLALQAGPRRRHRIALRRDVLPARRGPGAPSNTPPAVLA